MRMIWGSERCKRRGGVARTVRGVLLSWETEGGVGLFIGRGAVESVCKHLVHQRLKGAGMRWSNDGLKHLMAIKAAFKSGHFETLWHKYKKAA